MGVVLTMIWQVFKEALQTALDYNQKVFIHRDFEGNYYFTTKGGNNVVLEIDPNELREDLKIFDNNFKELVIEYFCCYYKG